MSTDREEESSSKRIKLETKKICSHGVHCERINPLHLINYIHSHLEDILKNHDGDLKKSTKYTFKNPDFVQIQLRFLRKFQEDNKNSINNFYKSRYSFIEHNSEMSKYSTINEKIEAASPYRYFLTIIHSSKETHYDPLSISFYHLLDPSLGDLDSSLHISFCVEIDWLLKIYERRGLSHTSMLIIYGVEDEDLLTEYLPNNVRSILITPPNQYGTHHTKMSIFSYKDKSIRIMIGTANLESTDWHNRTQGVWISPKCPLLESNSNNSGESPTNFRADLIKYLLTYEKEELQIWLDNILNCDFSEINVFLIASVPGEHSTSSIIHWGHRRLGNLLSKHAYHHPNDSSLIAQSSSIGSLGQSPSAWLCGEFLRSLSECRSNDTEKPKTEIQVIYPTINNVRGSYDGLDGGLCLPYSRKLHRNQIWLEKYLNQWKSDKKHRSQAMPHIKTYGLYDKNYEKLNWFVLSSANISKAAWGQLRSSPVDCCVRLHILSYECGVLFLPKFINSSTYFNTHDSLPLPYDLPPAKYQIDDHVWATDMFHK